MTERLHHDANVLQKVWRATRAGFDHFNMDHKWPVPKVKKSKEPHFLFIATPPYSGSTALAQILNSSHGSCFLQKRAEGQWLVPGMCTKPDCWRRETKMNWKSIRAVWLERFQLISNSVQDIDLIIEKSPPNLLRIDKLIEAFPNNSIIAYNRNPFANCASVLYRRHKPETKSEEDRILIVKRLAADWLFRSGWIKKWIEEMDLLYFTYEKFCSDPKIWISKIAEIVPNIKTANVEKSIIVKDYQLATLKNHNERQIKNLSQKEKKAISGVLKTGTELVSFFGYNTTEIDN